MMLRVPPSHPTGTELLECSAAENVLHRRVPWPIEESHCNMPQLRLHFTCSPLGWPLPNIRRLVNNNTKFDGLMGCIILLNSVPR